jgi:hypothetical protein
LRKYPIVEIEDMSEPFCGVRRKNMISLADAHPDIAEEWHYGKNAGWTPEDVSRASGVRCWWECRFCNRSYKAQINNRTSPCRSACPYCASKLVCDDNSLVKLFPAIAKEWHPSKNKKYKVTEMTHASGKRVWWLCKKCKHSWQCAIADRTGLSSGCPACYESLLEHARRYPQRNVKPQIVLSNDSEPSRIWYQKPSNRDFVSLYDFSKKLARQWHPTKNGKIKASHIARGSDAIAWWKCHKGVDHEWQAAVYSRTRNNSVCPFCSNLRLSVTNSLARKSPELAKQWHPKKNGKLTPKDVVAAGKHKYFWQCKKDKTHVWQASIASRLNGNGCPDCSHSRVSKDNCLNKDFPYLAAQIHPTKNGGITGDTISAGSQKKVWWICDKGPDHIWQATPANRTYHGSGCPCCSGKQNSITNCLATISPETAKQWDKSKNGKLTPRDVSPYSAQIVWWRCGRGHSWQQKITQRVSAPIICLECTTEIPPGTSSKQTQKRNR